MANTEPLKTERLLLRPLVEADLPVIARHVNDPRIARNLARVPWPYTLDHARTFYDHVRSLGEDEAVFAILVEAGDGPIGVVGYERLGPADGAELGSDEDGGPDPRDRDGRLVSLPRASDPSGPQGRRSASGPPLPWT